MPQVYLDQLDTALDNARDAARNVTDGTVEAARNAQRTVSDAGRRVQDKLDETRLDAAGKLHSAASALHQKAEGLPNLPGSETVAGMAHSAADRIESTAHYVREHDMRRMAAG